MTGVLTIEEAAAEARVSTRTIYQLCREGKVKAHKVGSKWRIHPEDLWAATLYTPDGTNDPMPRPNRGTFDDELEAKREARRRVK